MRTTNRQEVWREVLEPSLGSQPSWRRALQVGRHRRSAIRCSSLSQAHSPKGTERPSQLHSHSDSNSGCGNNKSGELPVALFSPTEMTAAENIQRPYSLCRRTKLFLGLFFFFGQRQTGDRAKERGRGLKVMRLEKARAPHGWGPACSPRSTPGCEGTQHLQIMEWEGGQSVSILNC